MVQAERLAAIGQTIAALSHHIKNILPGLRSGSEILKMGLDGQERQAVRAGLEDRREEPGARFTIWSWTCSATRRSASRPSRTIDLNEVVQGRRRTARGPGQGTERQVWKRGWTDDLPIVPADPEGIHRALLNIVGNALDAVEDGRNAAGDRGDAAGGEDGWVRITVMDNGVGIPAEKLDEIFKPFVSTKGSKGTGLGLAGEPQDFPRARRRHRGAEPAGQGHEDDPAAAAQEPAQPGAEQSDDREDAAAAAAGGVSES